MTLNEIIKEYEERRQKICQELFELNEKRKERLAERLEEVNLTGIVRNKEDGRLGVLRISIDYYHILFFPLTKKGTIGKRGKCFAWEHVDLEDLFEPYDNGGEQK